MFSHFTLGTNNLERSRDFYTQLLATLYDPQVMYVPEDKMMMVNAPDWQHPWIVIAAPIDDLPATWSNGFHLAFNASSPDVVDAFHATGLANGGIDEGAPGIRENYQPGYYAAYLRDPDGNKLQAVCYVDKPQVRESVENLSHITLGLIDAQRERDFYVATLGALGIELLADESEPEHDDFAFGVPGTDLPRLYLQPTFDGRPATWGNGTHTAFQAGSRAAVDAFHAAALKHGGTCEGAPGLRPQYAPDYYGAYVRDAVGNKLQAACRKPE